MTKKQAIEILSATHPKFGPHEVGPRVDRRNAGLDAIEALDRAGAFPSEETAAEIQSAALSIIRCEPNSAQETGALALRIASACRVAGLVK